MALELNLNTLQLLLWRLLHPSTLLLAHPKDTKAVQKACFPFLKRNTPTRGDSYWEIKSSVGAFPLTLKMRKLKPRIENTPHGNTSLSTKAPMYGEYTCKWPHASGKTCMRLVIGIGNWKKAYFAKLQWKHFFSHVQVVWGTPSHMTWGGGGDSYL